MRISEKEVWTAAISFVSPSAPNEKDIISVLESAINSEKRRLFSVLTYDNLLGQVNVLGSPKLKKHKNGPGDSDIFNEAKFHVDNGSKIPENILVDIIKYNLSNMRQQDEKFKDLVKKVSALSRHTCRFCNTILLHRGN